MFQNKRSFAVFVFLAALLSAGIGLAAEEQVPWHVKEAEVRIPVTVSIEEALLEMPPQVYLADLPPIETKGLAFDRKTKGAVKAKGSATFRLKPEYRWFSCRIEGNVKVFVDDKEIRDVLAMKKGRHDPRIKLVSLPPNAKTLRIEADAKFVIQPGFITRGPTVARAALCLPGFDPTSLVPLVHTLSGQSVGCRILWAHPTEPMSILLDCSSGEAHYLVYLVDRSKQPTRLDWAPKAGLIVESRYLDRYDPKATTVEGFLKLWDGADFIAEKSARSDIFLGFFPFRPMCGDAANYFDTPRGAPLALCRYTGFFHIPETQDYEFDFNTWPGGYLLFDDRVVSELQYEEACKLRVVKKGERLARKKFGLKLEKGLHRLDFYQYGSGGRFYVSLAWGMPGNPSDHELFGRKFSVWEPLAEAMAGAMTYRERTMVASFTWHYADKEWLGQYPAGDVILLSFVATLSQEREDAVFRWRFDDGHTAEGRQIEHHFFAPGTRQVELDVLDGPGGKVIARAVGTMHVHVNWSWPKNDAPGKLADPIAWRTKEFASVTPIEEVVSLYYWSLQHNWIESRIAVGAALAGRLDEVIEKCPYTHLLELARSMAEPAEARHDIAEKLLGSVMGQAPAGGDHWKSAATALADILVSVHGKPKEGLQLLERAEKTEPILDMTGGWRTAKAKRWYPGVPEGGAIADETQDLQWSDGFSFSVGTEGDRGTWVAKDIELPATRQGKELVLDLGSIADSGIVWFNGKRLTGPRRGGELVIPAEMQRCGEPNRFLALFQGTAPPEFLRHARTPEFDFTRPAEARPGFIGVPMEWYTCASCEEKGMNYAYYEGRWKDYERQRKVFPDFDKMEPIKKGKLKEVDLSPRGRDTFFGMIFTGYVKVSAGVYEFTLHSLSSGSRLLIDSKMVINNDAPFPERPARGKVYLGNGVHSVTLVYFQDAGKFGLNFTLPDTFVSNTEAPAQRVTADALLLMGENEKAAEILLTMKPDAWPIDEQTQLKLTSDLRRIRRRTQEGGADAGFARALLDEWLRKHPMLRTVPDFMLAKMEAVAAVGDYARALTLGEQIGCMDLNETQWEQLMLVQVKAAIKAGKMDAARDVYIKLKQISPYSSATIEAREAITKAVSGKQ